MKNTEYKFKPIGIIRSPFTEARGTPIQAGHAEDTHASIEVFDRYAEGLKDIDGFSHIILLYYFHLTEGFSLKLVPFLDDQERGVFATRAPRRPNPIGFAVVKIIDIKNNIIHFSGTDMINGTPVLDIKPYVPAFDIRKTTKTGWLENKTDKLPHTRDDGRFIP